MVINLEEELNKKIKERQDKIKKQKQREYMKKWREKNPEKYKKIQRKAMLKYQLKNKEKFNQNQLDYYYRNRERILKKMKEKREKAKLEKNEK